MGCSQNSLTSGIGDPFREYPQVKRGSTHSSSEAIVGGPRGRLARVLRVSGELCIRGRNRTDELEPGAEFRDAVSAQNPAGAAVIRAGNYTTSGDITPRRTSHIVSYGERD